MSRLFCSFAAFWLGTTVMTAQIPNATKEVGSVEGHLTCSDGNVPARKATVSLIPLSVFVPRSQSPQYRALKPLEAITDFDGYYAFPAVPPGDYIVDARSPGYANDLDLIRVVFDRFTDEQKSKLLSGFPKITVKSFVTARKDVTIHRAGAITGKVSVDTGGTVAQLNVEATLVSSPILGDVDAHEKPNIPPFSRRSPIGDRGEFRIAGLPAGSYRLSVRLAEAYFDALPSAGPNGIEVKLRPQRVGTAELTVYAPSATEISDAKLVEVRDGDEVSDSNISIPMGRLHSITGTVVSSGRAVPGAEVSIQREGNEVQPSGALSDENGSFRFDLLPGGSYILVATPSRISDSGDWTGVGRTTILINDRDVADAVIQVTDKDK
ncbi:carboxypeptidase-like regulatory domain-containing protein [Edaphobacter modestus]|nr:carboxypeptidase-like regulatory domain-containing protein [Edaphobacter modestus]